MIRARVQKSVLVRFQNEIWASGTAILPSSAVTRERNGVLKWSPGELLLASSLFQGAVAWKG